jgi:hypothetical protein
LIAEDSFTKQIDIQVDACSTDGLNGPGEPGIAGIN